MPSLPSPWTRTWRTSPGRRCWRSAPSSKAERLARYVQTLRRDLLKVSEAASVDHPGLLGPGDVDIMPGTQGHEGLAQIYGYREGWGVPGAQVVAEITELMRAQPEQPGTHEVVQREPMQNSAQEDAAAE